MFKVQTYASDSLIRHFFFTNIITDTASREHSAMELKSFVGTREDSLDRREKGEPESSVGGAPLCAERIWYRPADSVNMRALNPPPPP